MVSKQELEERVECGHCGGIQALFSRVRCAAQLEDTCTCPVEPPEMTEMKREQAHLAAALATKEKNVPEGLNCRSCNNKGRNLLGLPCVCGAAFNPPVTAEEIKELLAMARRKGLEAAATLIERKSLEAFQATNDPLANALRTLVDRIRELAKKKAIDF